jgi:hypothetical protein
MCKRIKEKRTVQRDNTIYIMEEYFKYSSEFKDKLQSGKSRNTGREMVQSIFNTMQIELVIQELSVKPIRVINKAKRFNLKEFARLEESPQA